MPRQPAGTARYTLFILLLILYNQLGIDVYLPSMPAMVSALDTTTSAVQRTLTLYFVGFSLSTFVWGALSSSFGRKPLLLFGTCLFCLGSLLCAFAPSINFLLASRCIQGVGGAAPSILSRAIMRDVFEGAELLKRAAYRSMVWITIPIIAPLLGGYVQDYLGWRWNFALLALFSALVFLLVLLFLPETQKREHKRPLGLRSIARDYAKVASNRLFWGNVLGMTLIYAMLVSYNAISPFLMQERLHLSPIAFGWALLFTSTGYFLGSFLSSWLSTRKPLKTAMNWGFAGCLFCSLAMLILSLLQLLNLWAILLPMFGLLFFSALVYPPCVAGTVAPFSRVVGTAAALVSCIVFLGSSLTTSIASHLPAQSLLSLSCIVTLLSVITPIIYHRLVFINERLS